jgi:hypothetical protein
MYLARDVMVMAGVYCVVLLIHYSMRHLIVYVTIYVIAD